MQRFKKKTGQLEADRIAKLERLGFNWKLIELQWEEMFGRLVAYKRKHHNCNVPWSYGADPRLAKWVGKQRGNKKCGKLSVDRITRLERLGFDWTPLIGGAAHLR